MQTQTSNTLHNAIMEVGSKDRPPMLAPGNYVQWKSRIKRYIDTKPNHELIHYCLTNPPYKLAWAEKEVPISEGSPVTRTERFRETYKNVSQDIRDQLNAEAEAFQIILTGIDNDIYSTVDACPNACEMWKAIERNKGKAIVNSSQPIYDQEPPMVAKDDEMSKEKEIDKLMALISPSFKKIYKPTNNNLRTSSNTCRANQDNSLRINRGVGYENQKFDNVTGTRETVGSTVVQKFGIQCYNCKEFRHVARECQKPKRVKDAAYHRERCYCELEAHYMYMAQIQEVSLDAADSGPIFDDEPLQNVSNDDHYNMFTIESAHPEQPKFVPDTYPIKQDAHNVIIDSLDMSYDREEIDQNDDDNDLANEQMKFKLSAHQETISILSQQKEAQIKLSKTHEGNELDKVIALEKKSREYYYADHMNAILGVYTELDEDLKALLQDKGIIISELKKVIEKLKEKSMDTKFEKSSVIRQPNAFKSQRPSVLGKPTIFLNSLERKVFSKSKSVTQNNVSNDFSKPVTAQTLPPNKKPILKNTNVLAPGMYKLHTEHNQTRTSQLPQDSRKTNKRVSFSTGVIPTTSVSRPQLKSNPMGDNVMQNNSQGKKQDIEDHHMSVKFTKNKTFVTACNDSLKSKTLNVNVVCATCDKCVLNDKHDIYVLNSVEKPFKKIVASESN
nr:hypothetical protein [Tanacetum cinerariifolium]